MKFLRTSFLLLVFLTSCDQSKTKDITEVSQNELNSVYLLDVRTPEEFEAGHLENAINVNWYDADFADQMKKVPSDKTIYVYCKKGGRSAKAAHLLDSLGYKKVVDLLGGYEAIIGAENK